MDLKKENSQADLKKELIELDDIDKETIDLPYIQNENTSLSMEISHNRIIFLDKPIKRREKTHKNWKYSYWKDYRSNFEVEILDRDYWKSAELMRQVLENKKKSIWLLILWLVSWLVIIFIVLAIVSNLLNSNTIKNQNVNNENKTPIITAPIIENPIENIPIEENKNIDNFENNLIVEENKNKNDFDLQNAELNLQLKIMSLDYEKIKVELNEKNLENEKLNDVINQKELEIEELRAKIKNLTSNEFYLFLGTKIVEECEKNANNYCKELYFNYLQK